MDAHVKLDLAKDRGEREVDPLKYQTIVGSLMYIALATRPDISHAVSALSRFTAHHCLHFSKSNTNTTGYTDSDWANDSADRKSQGHVFILKNGAISWQSQKQDLVAASTTEAEYIACSEASREARWLRQLQRDVKGIIHQKLPTPIYTYSQGALSHITTGIR